MTPCAESAIETQGITFVAPPFLGHMTQMLALAQNLVTRGHVVSVVTSAIQAEQVRKAGGVLVPWEMADENDKLAAVWRRATSARHAWLGELVMFNYLVEQYDRVYESLREPLLSRRGDIFVFDRALIPAMDIAFSEGIKFFILSRALASVHDASWRRPLPYSATHYPMTRLQTAINVLQRLWHIGVFFTPMMRLSAKRAAKNEALRAFHPFKAAPVIVGNAPLLELAQPVPANIKRVGPIISRDQQNDAAELISWLDGKANVVYAAFGTLAVFTQAMLQILCAGLLATGYQILCSLSGPNFALLNREILPTLADDELGRLRVERFVAQQQVLEHRSVSAFVSHASPNGVMEALIAGKPIVAIPLFGDQCYFGARVQELGVGLTISKARMTVGEICSCVRSVVENKSYSDAALAAKANLEPLDGLSEATRLIETAATRFR